VLPGFSFPNTPWTKTREIPLTEAEMNDTAALERINFKFVFTHDKKFTEV